MTNNHERNKRTAAAADCLMAVCFPSASANTIASLHIESITFPETTIKQRDLSVSGRKKALFFTQPSNPDRGGINGFEVIKSEYLQDERVIGSLTGIAIVEIYRNRWYEHV
jgi:hypothetical protein